ncbi:MAG: hypothetical protein O4965_23915, partial [Trichodesmium sp. St19_bin1]|nr:hypothetical protein [Trichodesmium sp. St19_bin1]
QMTDALGRQTQMRYDQNGNLSQVVAPDGGVTGFVYDELDNLLAQTGTDGNTTNFEYEPNFNQLSVVTDAKDNQLKYSYDDRGNATDIIYADGSRDRFKYDSEGNLILTTNRREGQVGYSYDDVDRLIHKQFGNGDSLNYEYDDRGNLIKVTDESGETVMVYDDADRLTKITYPTERWLEFTYENNRRSSMVDDSGGIVKYGYDGVGRLRKLTDGENELIVQYSYDNIGRLAKEENGNGTATVYEYDDVGQLVKLTNFDADNQVNSQFEYSYDDLGRRSTAKTLDGDWEYGYDAVGQLISAKFDSSNSEIPDQNLSYTYDAVGNRISTKVNGQNTDYQTNNLNQYGQVGDIEYEYDADGNLIEKTEGGNVWQYEYNVENRLVKVLEPDGIETEYEYDVLGNRIATVYDGNRTEYLVDPFGFGNVVGEFQDGDLVARYVHGLGLVSRVDGNGEGNFYDFNAIGSTVGLTDGQGDYVNRYHYGPFGKDVFEQEQVANQFEFVGQFGVMEEANGLDFMRARFYDSLTGNFSSPDPIGIAGRDTNLYRYTFNNPISYTDPSGNLFFVPVLVAAGIGALIGAGTDVAIQVGSNAFDSDADLFDIDGGSVLVSAGLGAVGGGATAAFRNTTKILSQTGKQFSHGIPSRLSNRKWLTGKNHPLGRLNGEYVTPRRHYQIDKFGGYGGVIGGGYVPAGTHAGVSRFPYWLQRVLRTPSWLRNSFLGGILGNIYGVDIDNSLVDIGTSFDPNDIIGPAGVGEENWLTSPQTLPYTIRFENDPEKADAPAVFVTVTQQLDSDLDWNTFELGNFGFGDINIEIPPGYQNYTERIDLTETIGYFVD